MTDKKKISITSVPLLIGRENAPIFKFKIKNGFEKLEQKNWKILSRGQKHASCKTLSRAGCKIISASLKSPSICSQCIYANTGKFNLGKRCAKNEWDRLTFPTNPFFYGNELFALEWDGREMCVCVCVRVLEWMDLGSIWKNLDEFIWNFLLLVLNLIFFSLIKGFWWLMHLVCLN